ncbi:fumarylacetoacetate hydrolase family protein [Candidatus Synechococcus calcipolaris G9]|uniref:Fumarylacetoacetate hydrolase family protein n=2 Tax=Synechococcus TaxID=1129 RepID=A0ABT6EXW3_9SYNE|nr:fumarylacetoacetate hydrolase family protein [Candidatus Synechococcus calcipolaris G9]
MVYYGSLQVNREVEVWDAAPWLQGQPTGTVLGTDAYQLLAPCLPSKIVAVGRNYPKHAAEMGSAVPDHPLIFLKPPTTIQAPERPIWYPSQTQQVDYEGELALIIGDRCRECSETEAIEKIWGYTIANDVTARDLQKSEQQWTRSKGFDTFCPLGPWVVRNVDAAARLQTFVNDDPQPRQAATLDQMVFKPAVLVSFISQVMTLFPGDVILTGTPDGIGPLHPGDLVRVEIEGIGSLISIMGHPDQDQNASFSSVENP